MTSRTTKGNQQADDVVVVIAVVVIAVVVVMIAVVVMAVVTFAVVPPIMTQVFSSETGDV